MFSKYKKLFIMIALLTSLMSCSTVRINLGGAKDKRPITETKKFYLFGLIGEQHLAMKDYCGNGVSFIHEENTVSDTIVTALTLGIYAPRTVQIYCKL